VTSDFALLENVRCCHRLIDLDGDRSNPTHPQATPGQRRTLLAASLGWALDAFDAMLYSLVLGC